MAARDASEFLNLPFHEKLEFLYGLPARQKLNLILSAPEAERLVQSFSPEALLYTLKEIGSADAGDLLSMAMPEQVKGLFDLDCWDKDRPNLERMREWLEALGEAGRRRSADALMEADLELVTLLMRQYVKVHRLDEVQAALDIPSSRVLQFDEHYLLEVILHDNLLPLIQDFLEEIFERDYDYFSSLMEEIHWGVEAELEEQAYQYRSARLADRGFPDFYAAQSVFAYLEPRKFAQVRASYTPPSRDDLLSDPGLGVNAALTEARADNSLLDAALTAGFAAEGKRQLRSEMALVTNQVLVARSIDFGDADAVKAAVEMTHHYLNLGLENLAGGDLLEAVEQLRDTHLKLLLRLGVSLTIDLRKRAEATLAGLGLKPGRVREIPYLDSPYRQALAGFMERMPRFFTGLERAGEVLMRDFTAMRDLHLAYAVLDQIEAMPVIFKALLGLDIASAQFRALVAGREVLLSQILLTALVNHALGGVLGPAPIEAGRLPEVRAALTSGNGRPARLSTEFHRQVEQVLARRLDDQARARGADFVNSCLNLLEQEFAELDPAAAIDPRFIRSLLLRRA